MQQISPITFGLRQFFGYGLLGWPLAMLAIPLYMYLPAYLHSQWSLSLTVIGSGLLLARLSDVITDPLIGYWRDKSQSLWPRSRQILLGVVLLLCGLFPLFFAQQAPSLLGLSLAAGLTFLGWTLIQVPYYTLAAELSQDPQVKVALAAWREGLAIVGVFSVLLWPWIMELKPTSPSLYSHIWLALGVLLLVGWVMLPRVKISHIESRAVEHAADSPAKAEKNHPEKGGFFHQAWWLWRHHPQAFRIFPPFFFNQWANALPASVFVFFVSDILQLAHLQGLFLLIYFAAGLLALPAWLVLAKRWGSVRTWQASMLLACASFLGVLTLQAGDAWGFAIISLLTGLSLGVDLALPSAMQAEIAQQQPQSAGFLFGLWGMMTKLTLAMGVGLALPLWQLASEYQLYWVHWWIYALFPIGLKILAWFLLQRQQVDGAKI